MCLERISKKSVKRFRDFLKTAKGGFVICYGTAIKRGGAYYPIHFGERAYKKGWNVSKKKSKEGLSYVPHFHRWLTLESARYWPVVITIWKVPVKDITAVGYQCGRPVVITKRCKLLGEVDDKTYKTS